jgi:hypothetical protein
VVYVPKNWANGVDPVNAANLNHIENGIATADAAAAAAAAAVAAKAELIYKGDWVAGTYHDGDVVVKDGIAFMCVGGDTAVPPDATLWGSLAPIPPVVNGQWIKGVGGAMAWSAIADADVPALATGSRLGSIAMPVPGHDWNGALLNGYYMDVAAANQPVADGQWYIGEVFSHDGNAAASWITQRAWQFTAGAGSTVYERRKLNGVWSAWVPLTTEWYLEKVGTEQIANAAWTNFATVLEVTIAVPGDYAVDFGCVWDSGGANNGKLGIGVNGANPPNGVWNSTPSPRVMYFGGGNWSRSCVIPGLVAGNTLRQYGWDDRTSGRQGTFATRYMRVRRVNLTAGSRVE